MPLMTFKSRNIWKSCLKCLILTICLFIYTFLYYTFGFYLRGKKDESIIINDHNVMVQELNIGKNDKTLQNMINCTLPEYPAIPDLTFNIENAIILYYDGSEKMFPFLVSSVNLFQRESVVILTFTNGLSKCVLLGVRCLDMSLTLTSENNACLGKSIIYSNVNICLPCYLYFFLNKGIKVIKLDLDIMCRKNVQIWSILNNEDEFSSFCSRELQYNIAGFRIDNTPQMISVWKKICEIAFKAGGLLGIKDILPTMIGSSIKVKTCSYDIVNHAEINQPNMKPKCVHETNVDFDIKLKTFKHLGMWHGDKTIKNYHNIDQSYLAYYLRLNFKDKTYPLDVRDKSTFHADSRYGYRRGLSIGRHYLHKWLSEYTKKYIHLNNSYDCLEIGDGHFISVFLKNKCKSRQSFDLNDKRATIKGNLEFPEEHLFGKFDIIICAQVLEHVDYPEKAMRGLNNLIKNNGLLFLSVPFLSPIHGFPHDVTRFTRTGIQTIAKATNFEIAAIDTLGNSLTSIGYMLEMSANDFWPYELDQSDNFQYFGVYAVLKKGVI